MAATPMYAVPRPPMAMAGPSLVPAMAPTARAMAAGVDARNSPRPGHLTVVAALRSALRDVDLVAIGSSRGHYLFTDLIDRILDRVSISPSWWVRKPKDESVSIRGSSIGS